MADIADMKVTKTDASKADPDRKYHHGEKTTVISIRVPEWMLEELDGFVARSDWAESRSHAVIRTLETTMMRKR